MSTETPDNVIQLRRSDLGDVDPEHPTDGCARFVLREWQPRHEGDDIWQHDASDELKTMPVRAAIVDAFGPRIEIGPYSITPRQAAAIAHELLACAALFPEDQVG